MTTKEAAIELGTSAHAVRKMIERGKLPAIKAGRDWLIKQADLETVRGRKRGRPSNKAPLPRAEYKRQATARRKQMQLGAINQLTSQEWEWLLSASGSRCVYCGRHSDEVGTLSMDHIVPVSRGGALSITNIVPCCKSCNCRKSSRTPDEAGMEMAININPLEHMKQKRLL